MVESLSDLLRLVEACADMQAREKGGSSVGA